MANLTFNWNAPTTKVDGSPVDPGLYYRLYEDGQLIADNIAVLNFSITDAPEGVREYYVTAVGGVTGLESAASSTVTVSLVKPNAPSGLSFVFS